MPCERLHSTQTKTGREMQAWPQADFITGDDGSRS